MEIAIKMVTKCRLQQLLQNWNKYMSKTFKVSAGTVLYVVPKGVYGKGHFYVIVSMSSPNSAQVSSKHEFLNLYLIPIVVMENEENKNNNK